MQNSSLLHRQDALGDSQNWYIWRIKEWHCPERISQASVTPVTIKLWALTSQFYWDGGSGSGAESELDLCWGVNSGKNRDFPYKPNVIAYIVLGSAWGLWFPVTSSSHKAQSRLWESSCLTTSLFIIRVGIWKRERAHY